MRQFKKKTKLDKRPIQHIDTSLSTQLTDVLIRLGYESINKVQQQ